MAVIFLLQVLIFWLMSRSGILSNKGWKLIALGWLRQWAIA
ncbi:hypothetical protein [Synechococcus elongatus]|nr:hypothetical protein [Synechococcus elongatus]WKW04483.1 hypothetical protein QY054_07740 [Synechococcus elongatus PCC 7942 = FACHB-805]